MAKSLRQAVIEYRAKHGLTQKQFAKICDVHYQTIYNLENGKRLRPTTVALIAMAMKENATMEERAE